jgi:hypothetical protein
MNARAHSSRASAISIGVRRSGRWRRRYHVHVAYTLAPDRRAVITINEMNHADLMGFGPLISRISCADADADATAVKGVCAKALCPTLNATTKVAAAADRRKRGKHAE